MKKNTKIWLSIACILIAVGLTLFTVALACCNWDFYKLNTTKLETVTHQPSESFDSISIHVDTADITILPASDGICKVVCRQWADQKYDVFVRDNTLTIQVNDIRKWYEYIGIHFGEAKITVYLPENDYKRIDLKSSTGDMALKHLSVGDLSITVSTGDVTMRDIRCQNLTTKGSTGDWDMWDVIAQEQIRIRRNTGDVEFQKCDAASIKLTTSTGDVEGSLLSEKVFITHTDTGDIHVPKTATGGICEITTDTGDIEIRIH